MYSMSKMMLGFFNLEPHKHIALHRIHKIVVLLATSYDPFNMLGILISMLIMKKMHWDRHLYTFLNSTGFRQHVSGPTHC